MLGKEENAKFVLESVCRERARFFLIDVLTQKDLESVIKFIVSQTGGLEPQERAVKFLKAYPLYQAFISKANIDPDFLKMYRFAAFVSKNIEKDKFIGKKIDDGLKEVAMFRKGKSYLIDYETQDPGDYFLQQIFVEEVTEFIEKTFEGGI